MGWKTILFPLHPPAPPSPCSRSTCFHSLFPSNAHTHTITHTRNNSLSTPRGVTNFSWALDVGLREVEMEKMKERGEAVLRWQLGGSHPHRKEPYTTSHLIFFGRPSVFSVSETSASPEHPACSLPLRDCSQFDHCLLPSFRYWRHITSNVHGAPICEEKLKSKSAVFASNLRHLCRIPWSGTAANQ